MNRSLVITFIVTSSLTFSFPGLPQSNLSAGRTKIGGLKLPDQTFGGFATAHHNNTDPSFTNFVNYYAEFAFWAGAINSSGKTLVSSGDGNEASSRPEWTPANPAVGVSRQTGIPGHPVSLPTAAAGNVTTNLVLFFTGLIDLLPFVEVEVSLENKAPLSPYKGSIR